MRGKSLDHRDSPWELHLSTAPDQDAKKTASVLVAEHHRKVRRRFATHEEWAKNLAMAIHET